MKKSTIQLIGLKMHKFNPTKLSGSMILKYDINGAVTSELVNFDFTKKSEILAGSIINYLKSRAEIEIDEDDIVGNLYVKNFHNEEKIEELLINYLSRLCEKVRFMERDKNHSNYMQLFDEIRMSNISFD